MMQSRQLERKAKKKSSEKFSFIQHIKVGHVKVFKPNCIMLFLALLLRYLQIPAKVLQNTCTMVSDVYNPVSDYGGLLCSIYCNSGID